MRLVENRAAVATVRSPLSGLPRETGGKLSQENGSLRSNRAARITGWSAVLVSVILAGLWAFWGIIENFHEGWFSASLRENLLLLFAQYLMPMFAFMSAALVGIRWPRLGGALHAAAGLGAVYLYRSGAGILFIAIPLIGLGALYALGRAEPRRRAALLVVLAPLLVVIAAGIEPAIRVAGRIDDGDRSARLVDANGVRLIWAPRGPGWPNAGGPGWRDAMSICAHLDAGGTTVDSAAVGPWRLPTIDEAVRSMARHGVNAAGRWDATRRRATYEVRPDKESPLWDPYSPVIYWWTATEVDAERAFMITYAGGVFIRIKMRQPLYFAFRCVRAP
jgi:hypothetical protein